MVSLPGQKGGKKNYSKKIEVCNKQNENLYVNRNTKKQPDLMLKGKHHWHYLIG